MAITRTYYYVGKAKTEQPQVKKHILRGTYAITTADSYSRTTRCTLTFSQITNITDVLGLFANVVGNTGLVPVLTSVSGNILTFALLECANAAAPLDEKAEEVYDQNYTFHAAVAGI